MGVAHMCTNTHKKEERRRQTVLPRAGMLSLKSEGEDWVQVLLEEV